MASSQAFDKTFKLNSANRLSSSRSSTDLSFAINLPDSQDLRVMVKSITIPKVYLNLEANQTLVLSENGTLTNITLPAGNYDIYNFAENLQTYLNDNTTNASVYIVSASTITGKLTFTCSSGTSTLTTSGTSGVELLMGLDISSTYAFPFVSSYICVFNHHENISLHTDLIDGGNDVLCVIPVANTAGFDYIHYNYRDENVDSRRVAKSRSNVFNFKLLDSNNNFLELGYLEWEMELHVFEDFREHQHRMLNELQSFIDYASTVLQKVEQFIELKNGSSDSLK